MRTSNKSRSRNKNNNRRQNPGNVINRVFDSSGPEGRVRGTPQQSRLFEKEADRVGFTNLVASGYDPESMGEMFQNMNEMRRYYGETPPEFLLTHPITSSRVSDAFNAAEGLEKAGTKKDSLDYSFIRSRLKVYYEKIPSVSVQYFEDKFEEIMFDESFIKIFNLKKIKRFIIEIS